MCSYLYGLVRESYEPIHNKHKKSEPFSSLLLNILLEVVHIFLLWRAGRLTKIKNNVFL